MEILGKHRKKGTERNVPLSLAFKRILVDFVNYNMGYEALVCGCVKSYYYAAERMAILDWLKILSHPRGERGAGVPINSWFLGLNLL
jgi:hypothetical protein